MQGPGGGSVPPGPTVTVTLFEKGPKVVPANALTLMVYVPAGTGLAAAVVVEAGRGTSMEAAPVTTMLYPVAPATPVH
jgi:hypothetical protein